LIYGNGSIVNILRKYDDLYYCYTYILY